LNDSTLTAPESVRSPRAWYWLVVWAVYLVVTVFSIDAAVRRYHDFRTGWSWDLAYYNQWFWSLGHGDSTITVRPIASYAIEGPSVWKANYLSPIRLAIFPIHYLRPEPTTLLAIDNIFFWLLIPAAAKLLIDETGNPLLSLATLVLVPLTPLARPLAANDFREMQMAVPFAILAIAGWRQRHRGWTALGIAGMLACRQEWAVVVAMLPLITPREQERPEKTLRWTRFAIYLGIIWFAFAFLGYLRYTCGKSAPTQFLKQFGGERPWLSDTLKTTRDFLWIGLSAWIFPALLAPRVALVAFPWVWSLASGKWAIRFVGVEQWHHIRYCAPYFALFLAAGLIGWARLTNWIRLRFSQQSGGILIGLAWVIMAVTLIGGQYRMITLMSGIPDPVPFEDVEPIWKEIAKVRPNDGVIAYYDLTAPLSSRPRLFSYVMNVNEPKGWPHELAADIRFLFLEKGRFPADYWEPQKFRKVWAGTAYEIWRRD
jgi:hypothetical protein